MTGEYFDRLETAIHDRSLPSTEGFFFGVSNVSLGPTSALTNDLSDLSSHTLAELGPLLAKAQDALKGLLHAERAGSSTTRMICLLALRTAEVNKA